MKSGRIIAVLGMAASGKGTIVEYLESIGYPKVHFGGMVYEEVQKRGLDIVTHERSVREDIRKKEGNAVLAKRASKKTDQLFKNGNDVVVFDGLYSWTEYKYLKQKYGDNLVCITVFTPIDLRYDRAINRQEQHRRYSADDIKKRDYQEIEYIEKGGPIAMSDYTIINDSNKDSLINKLNEILKNLLD